MTVIICGSCANGCCIFCWSIPEKWLVCSCVLYYSWDFLGTAEFYFIRVYWYFFFDLDLEIDICVERSRHSALNYYFCCVRWKVAQRVGQSTCGGLSFCEQVNSIDFLGGVVSICNTEFTAGRLSIMSQTFQSNETTAVLIKACIMTNSMFLFQLIRIFDVKCKING